MACYWVVPHTTHVNMRVECMSQLSCFPSVLECLHFQLTPSCIPLVFSLSFRFACLTSFSSVCTSFANVKVQTEQEKVRHAKPAKNIEQQQGAQRSASVRPSAFTQVQPHELKWPSILGLWMASHAIHGMKISLLPACDTPVNAAASSETRLHCFNVQGGIDHSHERLSIAHNVSG